MKLKLDIKIDSKTATIVILFLIFLMLLICALKGETLLALDSYTNCTCPINNYMPYT